MKWGVVASALVVFVLLGVIQVKAQTNLVADWHFDECSGSTTADATGNGNTGILNGASWTTDSVSGCALHFDGDDDYVTITKTASTDAHKQIKVEAVIKRESTKDKTVISQNRPWFLDIFNDSVRAGVFLSSIGDYLVIRGTTNLTVGKWFKVSMLYDGSSLSVSVNDIQENSIQASGDIEISTTQITIGHGENDTENSINGVPFEGIIDEVQIYGDTIEACNNNIDDDLDNLIDCADPDCVNHIACKGNKTLRIPPSEEICDDNRDNDQDGLKNCEDPDCINFPICIESQNCDDGIDNDVDTLTDCEDPDCSGFCILKLERQVKELEERTSTLEKTVKKIIEKIKCIVLGRCDE